MAGVVIPVEVSGRSGTWAPNGDNIDGSIPDGSDSRGPRCCRVPSRTYLLGMWLGMSAILMLFAAFTSAMVVRKGASSDWVQTRLPLVLYWNTAVLLVSSATLEIGRAALRIPSQPTNSIRRGRERNVYTVCLCTTLLLGVAFVAGQLYAWVQLAAAGLLLGTNPSSSFIYLLTASHGLHLLGGIVGLTYLVSHIRRTLSAEPGRLRTVVDVVSLYWHFMNGLWVYILVLLIVRF